MGKKKNKAAANAENGEALAPLGPSDWIKIDKNPLKTLTGKDASDFSEWESKPTLFKADDIRKRLFKGLMDMPAFEKFLKTEIAEELTFGLDIRAVKTKDGKREPDPDPFVEVSEVPDLYHKEGYTLQFLQPQRFNDNLWRLLAALEAQLGCLVGCNTYLTPKDTQGLAPHHDDVELFICQTQGKKRWRLYSPKDGYALPATSSKDFPEADIGEPVMDVTLEVGDVLYMPRGTIHQAVASEGSPSSHLTISTYQHWNLNILAATVLQQGAEEKTQQCRLPVEIRKGLPHALVFDTALEASLHSPESALKKAKTTATSLAESLRALASQLESKPETIYPSTQSLAESFFRDRLPPHPAHLAPEGPNPTADSTLYCKGRRWFMTKKVSKVDEEGEIHELIKLCSCINNDRTAHMMQVEEQPDEDDEGIDPSMLFGGSDDEDEDDEDAPELVELEEAAQSAIAKLNKSGNKDKLENGSGKSESGKGKRKREGGEDAEAGKGGAKGEESVEKTAKKQKKKTPVKEADAKEAEEEDGGKSTGKKGKKKKEKEEVKEEEEEEQEDDEGEDEDEDEDEEDDDDDDVEDDGLPGILFPIDAAEALAKVLCTSGTEGVAVKDLPLPDQATQMHFAWALWAEGVVSTKPVEHAL